MMSNAKQLMLVARRRAWEVWRRAQQGTVSSWNGVGG